MYEYLSTLIDDATRGITDKRVPVVLSHCGKYSAVGLPGYHGDAGILHLFVSNSKGGWKRIHTVNAPSPNVDETFAKALTMSENGKYIAALTVNVNNGECKYATVFRITPISRLVSIGVVGLTHIKDKQVRHFTVSNSGECITMPGIHETVTTCGYSKHVTDGRIRYSVIFVTLICVGLTLLI